MLSLLTACGPNKNETEAPHLPLDIGSSEYQQLLGRAETKALSSNGSELSAEFGVSESELQSVRAALATGERSLKWLEHMNSFRDETTKLRLTTRSGGLQGTPIESPKRYSPAIIQTRHNTNLGLLDDHSRAVLLENRAFSRNPGISDEDFVVLAKKIDSVYQSAARWQLISPWLRQYESASRRDVRGYYELSRDPDAENKIANFENLEASQRERMAASLVMLCRNSGATLASCSGAFEGARVNGTLQQFFARFLPAGRSNWNSFFDISGARRDVQWQDTHASTATLPFRRHANDLLTSFVKENVEEEFSWGAFRLNLDLKPSDTSARIPFVIFQPGATPHVEALGGNQIVMDANAPLTEWDVQWTIRHEFGHVLGLPDCYVEFFDPRAREMVNYQLDVTDLMCSRAGRMNERIFNELRRAYFQL